MKRKKYYYKLVRDNVPDIIKASGKTQTLHCSGVFAEIIQHECDHLRGVLI